MAKKENRMRLIVFLMVACIGCTSVQEEKPVRDANEKPTGLTIEQLYEGFQNPPKEARPIVFWWWNNNQVSEEEALRELEVMKEAGISGVTIIPIQEPFLSWHGRKLSQAEELEWQGEAWNKVVLATVKRAKELDMTVDVYPGSGWPYGGSLVEKESEQVRRFGVFQDTVQGPVSYKKPIAEVFKEVLVHGRYRGVPKNPSLRYVWQFPANPESVGALNDVTNMVTADSILKLDIPEGKHLLAFGIEEWGHRHLSNTVKGAGGPAIDHFQQGVTYEYLNKNKALMEAVWNEPLSDYVRAFFDESIELHGGNWTASLPASFQKRKGYDIAPYLPFVLKPENDATFSPSLMEEVQRARYDFSEHLCHLLHENHFKEVHRFHEENGMTSRIQAYGNPDYFDIAKGYMIPDIPETDTWLYLVDPYSESFNWRQGEVVNLYAAAGGALRNKQIISNETMTNVMGLFQTTLATVKQSDDMNFISGITKATLHGFNFSPPDAPFPGLVRFGTFFSENNTWWPYVRHFTDYNARLSHVFQMATPASEIAFLGPTADIWSKSGLRKSDFLDTPPYFHKLWEAVAQLGGNFHYLHEEIIQKAKKENGELTYGPLDFKVLFVVEMKSMQPETAEAIQAFAEQGGKVVFVGKTPATVPGLVEVGTGTDHVKKAIEATKKAGGIQVIPPTENKDNIYWPWLNERLVEADFPLKVAIQQPQKGLYHKRAELAGEDLLFFTNTYRKEAVNNKVAYQLGSKGLWRWNPETGERNPYEMPYSETGFEIRLQPLESVLLVTGEKGKPTRNPIIAGKDVLTIGTPWEITFAPVDSKDTFSITVDSLFEFTTSPDDRIKRFSGVATYKTTFQLDEKGECLLSLVEDQDFISEITLNGKQIGVNWYGSKLFDISQHVQEGENILQIKYTTTLWNKMRNTEQGTMFFDKYGRQPSPPKKSGLLGPVQLFEKEIHIKD
jgi:hypothetical protein